MTDGYMLKLPPVTRQDSSSWNRHSGDAQSAVAGDSALLEGLSPEQCREVVAYGKITNFARNERLFFQDQPVTKLILIEMGSVKLTQLSPEGKEVILWLNGPGDAVGMHAGVEGTHHSCSATAMERCQVIVWESHLLEVLMSRYPRIQINLGRILARRLSELEERFREFAGERVPRRMALTLMRLSVSIGKRGVEGVEVMITREELAQMTGTTIFTVSRTLSKWTDLGMIGSRREGVVIVDPDRLRRHAGVQRWHAAGWSRQRWHALSGRSSGD
jgi:CRP-like cAMP-binding protein